MTTPEPPSLGYEVEMKIVNLGENYQTPKPGSEEFRQFSSVVESSMKNVFRRMPRYKRTIVDNIIRFV